MSGSCLKFVCLGSQPAHQYFTWLLLDVFCICRNISKFSALKNVKNVGGVVFLVFVCVCLFGGLCLVVVVGWLGFFC